MIPLAPIVSYAVLGVACLVAWVLVYSNREHLPIAVLLTIGIVTDLARRALRVFVLAGPIAAGELPIRGAARWAAGGEIVLFLVWPAAIAATALNVYAGRRPWPVVSVWAILAGALAIAYPAVRDVSLARWYLGSELAALAFSVGCAVLWYTRSQEKTSTAQAALLLILLVELVSLVGSWRIGIFDNWYLTQVAYLALFGTLTILQGGFVWQSRLRR